MPKILFKQTDGTIAEVQAEEGQSAMLAALGGKVKGILGECGGSLACATCHVYVEAGWADRLPPMSELENEMLDATICERDASSRLCCQLEMSQALDGLVLRLPAAQI